MSKLLLRTVALSALLAGPAMGADLGVRPVYTRPAAAVVDPWTGFYVGINAGGSIGVFDATSAASFTSTAFGPSGLLNSSYRYAPTGAVLGGQLGYNVQLANWVLGLEADWQWTNEKDTHSYATPPASPDFWAAFANGFGYALSSEQKLTDVGTLRGRIGVVVRDSLWYITGGLAWGTVKENSSFSSSCTPAVCPGPDFPLPGPFLPAAASFSTTRTGSTVGGGVETKFGGGWSAKLEYLYVDLGSTNNAFNIPINPGFLPLFTVGGVATAVHATTIRDNIVRVGLNYKFGSYGAAAVYK